MYLMLLSVAAENDRFIRDNNIDTDVEESGKEYSFACPRHEGA